MRVYQDRGRVIRAKPLGHHIRSTAGRDNLRRKASTPYVVLNKRRIFFHVADVACNVRNAQKLPKVSNNGGSFRLMVLSRDFGRALRDCTWRCHTQKHQRGRHIAYECHVERLQ